MIFGAVCRPDETIRQALPTQPGRVLVHGRNAALFSRNLFAGFMKCATCGGAIVTAAGGHGSPRYGCLRAWRNGPSACTNRLTIRAKLADAYLLDGLRAELLAPTTLDYITAQVRAALNARNTTRPQRLAEAQSARDATAQRLERLITAIEQGAPAAALTPRIIEQQAG